MHALRQNNLKISTSVKPEYDEDMTMTKTKFICTILIKNACLKKISDRHFAD
ncbi:hypothetical protein HMPREF9370_1069 [Neisseria wadsworthii 9715]|uniref:Uncharacterized protein n=1 Tax=Neisseria wadsworthii 9715 TaxID=1030841 RepID=G4CPQ9_9NEIS|nr:hypothetical protein HMPREF9370_1069 [Neisseria wadsworthii 9715]